MLTGVEGRLCLSWNSWLLSLLQIQHYEDTRESCGSNSYGVKVVGWFKMFNVELSQNWQVLAFSHSLAHDLLTRMKNVSVRNDHC